MNNDETATAAAWLLAAHGIRLPDETVADPARLARELSAVAREAVRGLDMDGDQTGFTETLEALAGTENARGR